MYSNFDVVKNLPISEYFRKTSRKKILGSLKKIYLTETGYIESANFKKISRDGSPLPWFSYPAISFIENLNLTNRTVLEIGAGSSTFFWANRAKKVDSLEVKGEWFDKINKLSRNFSNINLVGISEIDPRENSDIPPSRDFQNFWLEIEQLLTPTELLDINEEAKGFSQSLFDLRGFFQNDVVVIDGICRNLSLIMAGLYTNKSSIIILDNAERPEYSIGKKFLRNKGWFELPFHGMGALNPYGWTTSIYITDLNHLGSINFNVL
jgi:hypothetical protein